MSYRRIDTLNYILKKEKLMCWGNNILKYLKKLFNTTIYNDFSEWN